MSVIQEKIWFLQYICMTLSWVLEYKHMLFPYYAKDSVMVIFHLYSPSLYVPSLCITMSHRYSLVDRVIDIRFHFRLLIKDEMSCYFEKVVLLNLMWVHYTAQKMKLSIMDFFSKCDQILFTEEIVNGKLHFLCRFPQCIYASISKNI